MDIEITGFETLVSELKPLLSGSRPVIIAVDVSGTADSGAGRKLAERFKCARLELGDENVAELTKELKRHAGKSNVILEGRLLLKKFKALGMMADVLIYVIPGEKNGRRGFWEGILTLPLDTYVARLPDEADREIVRYHHGFHPILNAQYLLEGI